MTYLSAARLAEQAEKAANLAMMHADEDSISAHMAKAMADLSAAVADLSTSLHEERQAALDVTGTDEEPVG